MKKRALMMSTMLALAVSVMGCATSGDMARLQEQEKVLGSKIDQALEEARAARATADAAKLQSDAAAAVAENAVKISQDRSMTPGNERGAAGGAQFGDEAERASKAFPRSMVK